VLKGLGQTHLALGQNRQALDYLNRAFALYLAQKATSGRADVNFYIAQAYQRLGQSQKAMAEFERTLADFRQTPEPLGVARTLIAQARLHAALGDLNLACERNEAALTLLESLRKGLAKYSDRATFSATIAESYALQIDFLKRRDQSAENVRTAFALSERARARSLLDMVWETRLAHEGGADAALVKELDAAQQRLNDEAMRRLSPSTGAKPMDARLRELTAEVEAVRTRLRVSQPRYAALTQPQTLDVAEVQRLLDPDSILLEYSLGEERSYLWAITADEITSHELPKRAEIEAAARALHQSLAANRQSQTPAATLSRMLLAPLAQRLRKPRLLVVADGALHYLPFAVLPVPGNNKQPLPRPLIDEHEVVNLPSASVLAVLRREFGARPAATRSVAIFADPVFKQADRYIKASVPKAAPLAVEAVRGSEDLPSWPSFAQEAEEILKLAPVGSSFVARKFDASRATAMQTDLTPYRIVHFATHGLSNATHPDLSWLALSMVDDQGRQQDGFLRLHEIYNLKLNAELVVMSACQTALGKEIKGEGLISLARGFMYAGAPRVVASLWQVNSTATAELMKRFYRGMLRENLSPAAALRVAQLELRRQGMTPYYWGGFVLQGEWR
jgi:CHAT domain-containing protein